MKISPLIPVLLSAVVLSSSAISDVVDLADPNRGDIFEIQGASSQDQLGQSLATADFDGDGIDDLCIASPTIANNSGAAYILFGSKDHAKKGTIALDIYSGDDIIRINPITTTGFFGYWIAGGDFNGDGIGDFAMGARTESPLERAQAGSVYVVFGEKTAREKKVTTLGVDSFRFCMIAGIYPEGMFGFRVGSGDFNGDGVADIIAGASTASHEDGTKPGEAYIVFGTSDLTERGTIDLAEGGDGVLVIKPVNTTQISYPDTFGLSYPDEFGYGVGSGDVNGDGFDDAVISARFADPDKMIDAGEVNVVFGSPDMASLGTVDLSLMPGRTLRIKGEDHYNYTGDDVCAGDIDGDGFDDILINAYGADSPNGRNSGISYVVKGSASLTYRGEISLRERTSDVVRIFGENTKDLMEPVSVGDIDNDGCMDILSGALGYDPSPNRSIAGTGYIIYGSVGFFTRPVIDLKKPPYNTVTAFRGELIRDYMGGRAFSCDLNGDGFGDAVFSAIQGNIPGQNKEVAGKVYICWGSERTPSETNYFTYAIQTGNSATIVIPSTAAPFIGNKSIDAGDIIGVFTPGGLCAGSGTWSGSDLTITVWGDNASREGIDGFLDGEAYRFRVYDVSRRVEYTATAVVGNGEDVFRQNGTSTLTGLTTPSPEEIPTVHFIPVEGNGGSQATVLIPLSAVTIRYAYTLEPGNEIGVMTPSGICAGACIWNGEEDVSVSIRGDDLSTETIEGFKQGETLAFRAWNSISGTETGMDVTFAGEGVFAPDGYIEVTLLKMNNVGVDRENTPAAFSLSQNAPNPFNPSTTIRFTLGAGAHTTLTIYAVTGAKIATLVEQDLAAGDHTVVWNAAGMPSGVYFCRLQAGKHAETIRMTLVK